MKIVGYLLLTIIIISIPIIIKNLIFPKPLEIEYQENLKDKENLYSIIIYISNQSNIDPLFKIRLKIDDKNILETYLFVGLHHTKKKIRLYLGEGLHRISIEHLKKNIKLEDTFNIYNNRWILINYWYDSDSNRDPHFTIKIQDIDFGFD